MVAVDCFHELLDAAVEEKADILFLGAGLPIKGIPVQAIRRAGVQVVPIVSSARAAKLIFKSWEKAYGDIPDGVVVEGPRAGGHLGFKPEQIDDPEFQLEKIVPEVVDALAEFEARWTRSLPVIAAGGIFTGEDIYRIPEARGQGRPDGDPLRRHPRMRRRHPFQTRPTSPARKRISSSSRAPSACRAGRSGASSSKPSAAATRRSSGVPSRCLESCGAREARYCISEALDSARKGDLENGFAFCGANAHRIESILSVNQLVTGLRQGFALAAFVGSLSAEVARRREALSVLRGEYAATMAGVRANVRAGLRQLVEDNRARYQEEKARMRGRLVGIKQEYDQAKARLGELRAELDFFVDSVPSLAPAT